MSYGVNSIQIHKKLRLDKRAGSDNWYARLTLPNGKRLVKTTKTEDIEAAKEVALRLYYEVDARIWPFGLNCIKYQWFIAPPGLRNRSLLSEDNSYLKIDKPIF